MRTWNTVRQEENGWSWEIAEYLPRPIAPTQDEQTTYLQEHPNKCKKFHGGRPTKSWSIEQSRLEVKAKALSYPDLSLREKGQLIAFGKQTSLKDARETMEEVRQTLVKFEEVES